jgi:RNA polymerase I-specific transcription initiation factor RRN6
VEPQQHKVLWLSLQQKNSKADGHRAGSTPEHSQMFVDADQPLPPRRLLLLCSPKALHLFDLASQKLHSVSHLVLPKDTHRILGVAPSRLDPAQAFILTSTNLLWVVAKEGKKNTLTVDILVSCPHQKDINDPTLRLDVSPGAYVNDQMACFVCVRSAKDTEMTVFWFISPEPGTPVRYHRDLISLNSTSNFAGLSILPAGRRTGNEPTSAAGRAMHKSRLRFFQLLTLGQDLDVHSALCAWSDEADVSVPPPDTRETLGENTNRRLRLLQSLTDAFAVPDEFDEHAVFGKKGLESLSLERFKGGIQQRVDFGLVAQRLTAAGGPETGGEDEQMSSAEGVDFEFIGEVIEQEKEDGYMPRHSLYVLLLEVLLEQSLTTLDWTWQRLNGGVTFLGWPANGMPSKTHCTDAPTSGFLYQRPAAQSLISARMTWLRDCKNCFLNPNQARMFPRTGKQCYRPWQPRCSSAALEFRQCRSHGRRRKTSSPAPCRSPVRHPSCPPNPRYQAPIKAKERPKRNQRRNKAM